MSSLLQDPYIGRQTMFTAPIDEEAGAQVRRLLAGMYPPGTTYERRREQRFPYARLCVLTPVDPEGRQRVGPTITAAGKHLSESGLSFFHPDPLPYRYVIASLERGDGNWLGFLTDLDWCRFTRQGWYESGGRFIRAVPSPMVLE